MASTYLHKNQGSPTNAYKFTYSVWLKRSKIGVEQRFYQGYESGDNRLYAMMTANDTIFCYGMTGGNQQVNVETARKFRDTNGWYHVVLKGDSTLGTATDRFQIWVNGVRETSLTISSNINQNTNFGNLVAQSNNTLTISGTESHAQLWDGLMSHIHFTDGYSYDASYFGSTDSTTGEWKINTSPSITYGNTGYFILKDGNSVTDQSGNGNNFTVGAGTLTNTKDCPSNIFCAMNPLQHPNDAIQSTYANGNTSVSGNNSHWQRAFGTIAAKSKGKWYYEWKCTAISSGNNRLGWDSVDLINEGTDSYYSGLTLDGNGELRGGIRGYNNYDPNSVQMTAISGGNFSFGTNDFLGMALDLDNQTISVYKNGTLEINAYSYSGASNCSLLKSKGHFIAPSVNFHSTSGNANTGSFNFGNGAFGSTQLTGTTYNDSNNEGVFKYQPPTNYLAWCTKNLNA